MPDSALNITIRVNGKQAQQQLRNVSNEIKQMQSMIGKMPTTKGASSAWSPTIARQQAAKAQAAAKQAAAAQQRILNQAWKQQTAQARIATAQQNKVLTQAWNRQQQQHKAHQQTLLRQQKTANAQALAQQKIQAKKMSKLSGLTPLGFAENLQQSKLVNAGKNINWVGRQLTYNFTLPIVAAGAGLFKFSMDIERATTQLSKVYGDITEDQKVLDKEVKALGESFQLLSTYFGVNQVEVIEIAAAWAAAGSAGRGLAENVRATLETMILGDMDAAAATEALIAIQAQWGFSTVQNADGVSELTLQLAHLNAIENATGISTEGLIEIIQRSGGTARNSGLEFRELAALASALVPATGDAAQAGTALRSIMSSLMAPTAQATEALSLMGITVTDPSFMGEDVMGRLKLVATQFDTLSDAQKGVVSSTIATKWQVARFDVLMRQIQDPLSFYNKALEVTSEDTRSLETRQRELTEVLSSNPKKFDIMTNAMKNALADAFIPMIPAIMSIVALISDLVIAFTNLSPETQKWITLGLAMLAVLGPLMSLLGSTMQLFGTVSSALKPAGKAFFWLIESVLWPLIRILGLVAWSFIQMTAKVVASMATMATKAALSAAKVAAAWTWAVAKVVARLAIMTAAMLQSAAASALAWVTAFLPMWAVVAIVVAIVAAIILVLNDDLREDVWNIVTDVARAFWEMVKAIGRAFMALGRLIERAMADIWEFLQYLNPFARHSPSLVDNVRRGVSTILDEYSRLRAIPSMLNSASRALEAFSNATSSEGQSFREQDLRKKANVEGASPSAQAAGNALVDQILQLERALGPLEALISEQENVVDAWARALKTADDQIDEMERSLKTLEAAYDSLGDQITAANNRISELADAPIEGMGALEDQIFANQHAQNLLNLELLEFEKRGLSLDSITDKYARMAGEIETLQGTQAELRGAGAGSDILGWYDDQISAIRSQREEMGDVEQTIQDIEDRLDALDLEGRFLELTRAINFDPLERQIEQLVSGMKEMPFDEIVRQILEQKAIVAQLVPQYEVLGDQIEREKEAIEAANVARDGIAAKLDVEQEKLDVLKQAYSDIKDLLSDMESALSGFASAMKEAADEASRLEDLFAAGEGLDFEDFGGTTPLGREGDIFDINAFNDEMQALLDKAMKDMGEMDLLGGLKKAWAKVQSWINGLWPGLKNLYYFWQPIFADLWYGFADQVDKVWELIKEGWFLFMGDIDSLWEDIKNLGSDIWNFWDYFFFEKIWHPIMANFDALWEDIKELWFQFMANFDALWEDIKTIDVFDLGWDLIKGLANGIWQGIQDLWDEILGNFKDLWYDIKDFFGANSPSQLFFDLGVDLIQGLIDGLASMMNTIWQWFLTLGNNIWQWAYDNIIGKVLNAIDPLATLVGGVFDTMWATVKTIWEGVGTGLQFIWNTMIAPIWDLFKKAFEEVVQPAFEFLRDSIIKPIMDGIYNAIKSVWNSIAGVIEGGVNFFVSAFNKIGDAVNAIAGFLHLPDNWRVPTMQPIGIPRIGGTSNGGGSGGPVGGSGANGVPLAAGGIPPTAAYGGVYNSPRAIVGEGSTIHPEFVIPTDPQYRSRALGFWEQAGAHLMAAGGAVPPGRYETLYDAVGGWSPPQAPPGSTVGSGGAGGSSTAHGGSTGWMDRIMGALSAAGEVIAKGALRLLWIPGKQAAQGLVNRIPNETFQGAGQGILNAVDRWVMGRDSEWDALAGNYPGKAGAAMGGVGDTGSGVTAAGIPLTFGSGSWKAFVQLLQQNNIPYTNLGTFVDKLTRTTGNISWHALNRAMDFGGSQAQLQRINHALYDAFKPYLHELIWTGPNSRNVWRGQDHTFSAAIQGDHRTHVHASMAQGGRFNIPRIPGGVNLNVSEGRSGEQVQILPIDEAHGGGTTIVIYGNLEFPNVKNGSDANDFIQNLRALAN